MRHCASATMKSRAYFAAAMLAAVFVAVVLPVHVATVHAAQSAQADTAKPAPTWSHDIAPIVYQRCTACHHPGGAGPFSLLTYADARRWGPQVLAVTQSHFMPPWLPEPGYGDFADVRRLSDHETELIREWVKAGMAEGDAAQAPP